jgi:hypothetical protein
MPEDTPDLRQDVAGVDVHGAWLRPGPGDPLQDPPRALCRSPDVAQDAQSKKASPSPGFSQGAGTRVNTNTDTMVRIYELECTFPTCGRGDGAHYKTPKLASGLALALLQKHRAENHPPASPPTTPSYTPLTDSVKLPAVPSTTADHAREAGHLHEGPRRQQTASHQVSARRDPDQVLHSRGSSTVLHSRGISTVLHSRVSSPVL